MTRGFRGSFKLDTWCSTLLTDVNLVLEPLNTVTCVELMAHQHCAGVDVTSQEVRYSPKDDAGQNPLHHYYREKVDVTFY